MLFMRYGLLIWIVISSPAPLSAKCMLLPEMKAINVTVVGVEQSWDQGQCTAICELNASKDHIGIYFQHCPKKGSTHSGNIRQRSDITVGGQAPCWYEFEQDELCTQDRVMAVAKEKMRTRCLRDTDCTFKVAWKANSFASAYNPNHEWEVIVSTQQGTTTLWVSNACQISQ